jgi:hypothetical protein
LDWRREKERLQGKSEKISIGLMHYFRLLPSDWYAVFQDKCDKKRQSVTASSQSAPLRTYSMGSGKHALRFCSKQGVPKVGP